MLNEIVQGDCLEVMKDIPSQAIDMILSDLPYGTTSNSWDSIVPLEDLWVQYRRIIKGNGAIVLTAQKPFDALLVMSNPGWFRYEWIWQKEMGSGFLNAKKMPLKDHENILVFYNKAPTYNPQMSRSWTYKRLRKNNTSNNYGNQQSDIFTDNNGSRYPKTTLYFPRDLLVGVAPKDRKNVHPTQKPVALFEYLICTYTNEGDTVLDNCIGSGTTAIACINTGRNYIGIEKESAYVEAAKRRVEHRKKYNLTENLSLFDNSLF